MEEIYEQKKKQLLDDLSDMSEIAEDMLQNAIKALNEQDIELAKQVINKDDVLDNYMITVEEEVSRLLSFNKPLISDARYKIALVNIATNLERIGDHATNIAETVLELKNEEYLEPLILIPELSELVSDMLDAVLEAKKKGKIRFIGFTGHRYPVLHQEMLDLDFDWDTVQMPLNVLDYHYRSFQNQILPQAKEKNMGIIGMKSLAAGRIFKTDISVQDAIRYSLSLPISTLVSGIDSIEVLEQNLKIAREFKKMSEKELNELWEKYSEFEFTNIPPLAPKEIYTKDSILFIGLNAFVFNSDNELTVDAISDNDIEYWLNENTAHTNDIATFFEDDILQENTFSFTEIKDENIEDYINSIDNSYFFNELN